MNWKRRQSRHETEVVKNCRYCRGTGGTWRRFCQPCDGTGKVRTMVRRA